MFGEYNKNLIENIDEIHFVINMDNGKMLGFHRDQVVKYVDVVFGGEDMTMVLFHKKSSKQHRWSLL